MKGQDAIKMLFFIVYDIDETYILFNLICFYALIMFINLSSSAKMYYFQTSKDWHNCCFCISKLHIIHVINVIHVINSCNNSCNSHNKGN